jgi:hypothetical protein
MALGGGPCCSDCNTGQASRGSRVAREFGTVAVTVASRHLGIGIGIGIG